MHFAASLVALALAALAPTVSAHGCILSVKGSSSSKSVTALGCEGASPKGHSTFYQAPRFVGSMSASQQCGANRRKGGSTFWPIDWRSALAADVKKGLPVVGSDGIVTMQFFQNNHDGAGPYHCEVSTDAKANSWRSMSIVTQVPGTKGISNAIQQYHTLKARLPSGTRCTGSGGACLVRCKNPNTNPFGGCMPIKLSGSVKRRTKRALSVAQRDLDLESSDAPSDA